MTNTNTGDEQRNQLLFFVHLVQIVLPMTALDEQNQAHIRADIDFLNREIDRPHMREAIVQALCETIHKEVGQALPTQSRNSLNDAVPRFAGTPKTNPTSPPDN